MESISEDKQTQEMQETQQIKETQDISEIEKFIDEQLTLNPKYIWIFNWIKLNRKISFSNEFILKYPQSIVPDVYCKHQAVTLEVAEKLNLITNRFLQQNPKIDSRIIDKHADKMHWETIQKYQNFTLDQLNKFSESLDNELKVQFEDNVLTFQKPSEAWISAILVKYIMSKMWDRIKFLLNIIINKQHISSEFVKTIYTISKKNGVPLFDMKLVAAKQPVPTDIMEEYMKDPVYVDLFTTNQKLDPEFIKRHYKLIKPQLLIKHQLLDDELNNTIEREYIFNEVVPKETRLVYSLGYISKQNYNIEKLQNIAKLFNVYQSGLVYGEAYLRCISGNLNINPELIAEYTDFDNIAKKKYTDDMVNTIISKASIERMPWYLFIKSRVLSEEQIELLDERKALGHIEWWLILHQERKFIIQCETDYKGEMKDKEIIVPLSNEFNQNNIDKALWWKYVPDEKLAQFFGDCIKATEKIDEKLEKQKSLEYLRSFLFDFIKLADWNKILRYEVLPEWFLRVFGQSECYTKIAKKEMFWWKVSTYQKLTISYMRCYIEHLSLNQLLRCQTMDCALLDEISGFIYTCEFHTPNGIITENLWELVALYQPLTEEFIRKYKDNLPIEKMKLNSHIPESYLINLDFENSSLQMQNSEETNVDEQNKRNVFIDRFKNILTRNDNNNNKS